MARIYNRDNINYSGLIGQAIQNANQTSQLYANKYQPWNTMGQGVSDVGNRLQEAGWKEFGSQQDDARAQAMQQRQFEQQERMQRAHEEFQREQAAQNFGRQLILNDINAKNALELARIQKDAQAEYNRDEWMKQYELSGIDYDFAKAAYAKDQSEENLMRLRRAEANVLHWANKSGAPIYNPSKDLPSVSEVSGTAGYDMSESESNLKKLFEGDWTDEKKSRALEIVAGMPEENESKIEEWTRAISNKGNTKEDYKREDDAANEEFLKTGKVRKGYRKNWKTVDGVQKAVGVVRK